MDRLLLPADNLRPGELTGGDVRRPYAAAYRDGLFADAADGVALPAPYRHARLVDCSDQPGHRRGRRRCLFLHRNLEPGDLYQPRIQAGGDAVLRRDHPRFLNPRGLVGAILRDQLLPVAGRGD